MKEKVPVYVWFKFNCYSWNLDKEFIAYLLGYEKQKGDYAEYVADYSRTSDKYKTINNYLVWTNSFGEKTMYDLAPFNLKGQIQDSIFVQLKALPEDCLMHWIEERAKAFPSFIKKRVKIGLSKNLDVLNVEYRDAKNKVLSEQTEQEEMA